MANVMDLRSLAGLSPSPLRSQMYVPFLVLSQTIHLVPKDVRRQVDKEHFLGLRDHRHRPTRAQIFELPVLDIQNPGAGDRLGRGDRRIRDHDDALSFSKLSKLSCLRESDADVATRSRPLEHGNDFEAAIIGFAAIDL